jgi:hypothetical protein
MKKHIIKSVFEDFKSWCANQLRKNYFTYRDLVIYIMMTRTYAVYRAKLSADRAIREFKKYGYITSLNEQYVFARVKS